MAVVNSESFITLGYGAVQLDVKLNHPNWQEICREVRFMTSTGATMQRMASTTIKVTQESHERSEGDPRIDISYCIWGM